MYLELTFNERNKFLHCHLIVLPDFTAERLPVSFRNTKFISDACAVLHNDSIFGPENVVFVFIKFTKYSQKGCRRV